MAPGRPTSSPRRPRCPKEGLDGRRGRQESPRGFRDAFQEGSSTQKLAHSLCETYIFHKFGFWVL
eukprot:5248745-Pyramimonas_sp.AAC.1